MLKIFAFRLRIAVYLLLLLFVFLINNPLFSFYVQQVPVQVKGSIQQICFWPLNEDSKADLIVIHSEAVANGFNRYLSVFINRDFLSPALPDYTLNLKSDALFFDLMRTHEGESGLLFWESDGLYFHPWTNASLETKRTRLITLQRENPFFDALNIVQKKMTIDLDQDGKFEIILPGLQKIHFFKQDSSGVFKSLAGSPLPASPYIQMTEAGQFMYRYPEISVHPMTMKGGNDLCIWQNYSLLVYPSAENKFYKPDPDIRLCMPHEVIAGIYSASNSKYKMQSHLVDINNDALKDVLVSLKSPNYFPYTMNQMQVYLNDEGTFKHVPDQILTANNMHGEFLIHDFNHDDFTDLSLLQLDLGLKEVLTFLLTGVLRARLDLYHSGSSSLFSDKPSGRFSFSWRPSLMTVLGKKAFLLNIDGDYNGDQHKDLMVGIYPETLQIYTSKNKGYFDKVAYAVFHLPLSENYQLTDWDGNGKTDLVFWNTHSRTASNQLTWIQF